MQWGQSVQTSEHSRTKFSVDPNDKKLVEATGSAEINGLNVTFYYNEYGKFEVIARRIIQKRSNVLVNDTFDIKLETSAKINRFIPIEKRKYDKNQWVNETFVEIDDGNDLIVKEFSEYQKDDREPYSRKYNRSSIITAYSFLVQFIPEFENMLKDKTVADHASKIIKKAEQI
jgi:hypothetical protein